MVFAFLNHTCFVWRDIGACELYSAAWPLSMREGAESACWPQLQGRLRNFYFSL